MLLPNQFNSLFELFAAFNFAYVISDQFNVDLQKKLIRGFDGVYSGLDGINKKIKTCEDTLPKIKVIEESRYTNKALIEDAKNDFNKFKNERDELTTKISDKIESVSKSFNFQYVCMFLGFYCVGFLLISAFFDETGIDNGLLAECIIILNFAATAFVIYALGKDKLRPWESGPKGESKRHPDESKEKSKFKAIGYVFTVTCLIFVAFITSSFYIIAKYKMTAHCNYSHLEIIVIFWSLLLATFHFILYAVRAFRNSTKVAPSLMTQVRDFETRYLEFYRTQVDCLLTTNETLEKMSRG